MQACLTHKIIIKKELLSHNSDFFHSSRFIFIYNQTFPCKLREKNSEL